MQDNSAPSSAISMYVNSFFDEQGISVVRTIVVESALSPNYPDQEVLLKRISDGPREWGHHPDVVVDHVDDGSINCSGRLLICSS